MLRPFSLKTSWIEEIQEVLMHYIALRLVEILLKTLEMVGPRITRAAITTIAIRTRIKAYSTRPCPFSSFLNMATTSLL
jgi:hypothetical protein